ncbi:MAG: site-specific integrase [Phycisphaerales bacterium]|nr:site-specific integrase [Phycisphaerales bacterium]
MFAPASTPVAPLGFVLQQPDNYELANNLKARFDLIQKKARAFLARERDVEPEQVRWDLGIPHDLRQTYGTRMARVIPMHVLNEYMGHAKITTTQEYDLAAETPVADRAHEALEAMTREDAGAPSSGRMSDACGPKATNTTSTVPASKKQ